MAVADDKKSPSTRVTLRFDDSLPWGEKEHYFHCLHGYILPALKICREEGFTQARCEYCGPLITPRVAEAFELASVAPDFTAESPPQPDAGGAMRTVPRRDTFLLRFDRPRPTPQETGAFRAASTALRSLLLERAARACAIKGSLAKWQALDVLVLKRSPMHPFYQAGGPATRPGYGDSRRSIQNTAEIAGHLGRLGFRATEIDVGGLALCDQIMAFHHARAVVGVRGAEFANVLWMQPGALAVMFATPLRNENHATRTLSETMGVRFISPPVDSNHFAAPPERVGFHLSRHM